MKKITIVLLLSLTFFFSNAQTKKDTIPPVQKAPAPTEKILSRNDLESFIKYMRENMSVAQYEAAKPADVINLLWGWFMVEYNKQQVPKK